MDKHDKDVSSADLIQCKVCQKRFPKGSEELCPDDYGELVPVGDDPLIGIYIDKKYEIISFIGSGGMSSVYKARHRYMDRMVAVKLLQTDANQSPEQRLLSHRRFEQEAKAASAISHPNVVTVFDFGFTPKGQPYLVMDFLQGDSLSDLLERKGKISAEDAVPIFAQICDGLDVVHQAGLVHRDLKPSNVMLIKQPDGNETVKIVDFGIAQFLGGEGKEDQVRLTQTGQVYGSASYMSPEQCQGKALDARADIYSMGCLMYEVLTGSLVFQGETFGALAIKHAIEQPKPFADSHTQISIAVEAIVMKCLEKLPDNRYQTIKELRHSLMDTSVGVRTIPLQADEAPAAALHFGKLMKVGAGIGLLIVLSGAWYFTMWEGAQGDDGTPLAKMRYQMSMQQAQQAISQKDYARAISLAGEAKDLSLDFDDRNKKLESLRLLADAYRKSGNQKELNETTKDITRFEENQALIEFEDTLVVLKALGDKKTANSDDAYDAFADKVMSVATKLESLKLFREEETLLWKAMQTYQALNVQPKDDIARFDEAMAECLHKQQRWPEIRWYLNDALQIRNAAVVYRSTPESLKNQIDAYLKIGEHDRDQSNFKDSDVELAKALALAEKNFANDNAVLTECINSYADLMRQMGKKDESKKLLDRADKLWDEKEKTIPGEN